MSNPIEFDQRPLLKIWSPKDIPMFIEVDVSRKEHVLPMVPAGKNNHEMLGGKLHA